MYMYTFYLEIKYNTIQITDKLDATGYRVMLCPNYKLLLQSAADTTGWLYNSPTEATLIVVDNSFFASDLIYKRERPKTRVRRDIESMYWLYVREI